jgi:hypothetical protein
MTVSGGEMNLINFTNQGTATWSNATLTQGNFLNQGMMTISGDVTAAVASLENTNWMEWAG